LNHIPSPVKFDKQKERLPIDLKCQPASDERFSFLPPPTEIKFKRPAAVDFQKSKGQNLQEFLLDKAASTINQNAFN
jgi:hypothetical protein